MSQRGYDSGETTVSPETPRTIRERIAIRRQQERERRQREREFQNMMSELADEVMMDEPLTETFDGNLPREGFALPFEDPDAENVEIMLDQLRENSQQFIQEYLTEDKTGFGSKRKLKKKTTKKKKKNVRNSRSKKR